MKTLFYIILLCFVGTAIHAKTGKSASHLSSIYINTPDSSVKANVTDVTCRKPQVGCYYHWYAANQVCVTNGAYSGKLLHGPYSSFYPNHFLLAQGEFRNGLKDGCWKRWLSDGSIHEIVHYKNGLLNGTYDIYSPLGKLEQRIYYRNGLRAGKTIFFSQDGTDSVIQYKKGVPVQRKENGGRKIASGDSAKTRVKKSSVDSTTKSDHHKHGRDSAGIRKPKTDTASNTQFFRKLKGKVQHFNKRKNNSAPENIPKQTSSLTPRLCPLLPSPPSSLSSSHSNSEPEFS